MPSGAGRQYDLDVPRSADAGKARGQADIDALFAPFDEALTAPGFLAMHGQIVDATIVAAPKQRNTKGRSATSRGPHPGGVAAEAGQAAQKDRDARWTVKYTKAKPSEEGVPRVDLAVPALGYKNHLGIDRRLCLGRHRLSLPRQ